MSTFFENGIVSFFQFNETQANIYLFSVFAACIIFPYLLGSVNSVKLARKLRGEGNPVDYTLTSYLHNCGWGGFLLACLFDLIKAALTIAFAVTLMGSGRIGLFEYNLHVYLALAFLLLGDILPIFNHFKGGHGTLIGFLAMCYLSLSAAMIVFLLGLAFLLISKYTALSVVVSSALFPLFYVKLFQAMVGGNPAPGQNVLVVFFIAALLVFSYWKNVQRIMSKEEPHIYLHKDRGGSDK